LTETKPTYNIVFEALEPVRKFMVENEDGTHYSGSNRKRLTNLRFDSEAPTAWSRERQMWLLFALVRDDLMDVVTNGDTSRVDQVFLKYFDGEVKRGKKLKEFSVQQAVCYREYKPRKETHEYTLFLVIWADWE